MIINEYTVPSGFTTFYADGTVILESNQHQTVVLNVIKRVDQYLEQCFITSYKRIQFPLLDQPSAPTEQQRRKMLEHSIKTKPPKPKKTHRHNRVVHHKSFHQRQFTY